MDNGRRDIQPGMSFKQFMTGLIVYTAIGLLIYLINF